MAKRKQLNLKLKKDENLNQKLSSENAGCYGIVENSPDKEFKYH
jgi:sulfide:quinone oxidoreductase